MAKKSLTMSLMVKMVLKNGLKCFKRVQQFSKQSKWSKTVHNRPKWAKIVQNVSKCYKTVQNGPQKGSYSVQNGQNLSNMVQYGIIWYNMVQFLSTKSSKWDWNNQVSWSSLGKILPSKTRLL